MSANFRDETAQQWDQRAATSWLPGVYSLRDAWFPVAHSDDLGRKVIRRSVHSQPYYLRREADRVHATEFPPDDLAAKRSHATEFTAGSGVYPVIERYGYLWVWYGNPANANEALIPNCHILPPEGGLPSSYHGTIRVDACGALGLENLLDLTHADFLHADVVGDESHESDTVTVQSTSETVTMIRVTKKKKMPKLFKLMGAKGEFTDFRSVVHVHVRSYVAISVARFDPGFVVPLFHPDVPESQHRTRINFTFNCTGAPWLFRKLMPRAAYKVGPQDNYVLRPQSSRYLLPESRKDLHSRFDEPGVRYREVLQQIAERQRRGDFSYGPDGDPQRDVTDLMQVPRV